MSQLNDFLGQYALEDEGGRRQDTKLTRIFTEDLSHGGRLYGEYVTRPERDRLACTIDGEPVCEIDLKASHLSILAALYRHPDRLGRDPYEDIEWVKSRQLRRAAKTLVQCSIYKPGGWLTAFPKQDDGVAFKDKYDLDGRRVGDLMPGIIEAFPFLDGSPSLTLELQFIEAEILMDVLERLCRSCIPAFPVHDSVLVRQSDEERVLKILQETLREYLGPHAPWLDVSVSGEDPRMIEPLPCPIDAEYHLDSRLEELLEVITATHSQGDDGLDAEEEDYPVLEEYDEGDF
ncbi:hypothetical protein HKCCE3408_03955 [Rhodobacterales bacterium HKCCE3408]|nr:hypothetical protein [Rhodobacterales bacterium HKCCE3408]